MTKTIIWLWIVATGFFLDTALATNVGLTPPYTPEPCHQPPGLSGIPLLIKLTAARKIENIGLDLFTYCNSELLQKQKLKLMVNQVVAYEQDIPHFLRATPKRVFAGKTLKDLISSIQNLTITLGALEQNTLVVMKAFKLFKSVKVVHLKLCGVAAPYQTRTFPKPRTKPLCLVTPPSFQGLKTLTFENLVHLTTNFGITRPTIQHIVFIQCKHLASIELSFELVDQGDSAHFVFNIPAIKVVECHNLCALKLVSHVGYHPSNPSPPPSPPPTRTHIQSLNLKDCFILTVVDLSLPLPLNIHELHLCYRNNAQLQWRGVIPNPSVQVSKMSLDRLFLSGDDETHPSAAAEIPPQPDTFACLLDVNRLELLEYTGGQTMTMGNVFSQIRSLHTLYISFATDCALFRNVGAVGPLPRIATWSRKAMLTTTNLIMENMNICLFFTFRYFKQLDCVDILSTNKGCINPSHSSGGPCFTFLPQASILPVSLSIPCDAFFFLANLGAFKGIMVTQKYLTITDIHQDTPYQTLTLLLSTFLTNHAINPFGLKLVYCQIVQHDGCRYNPNLLETVYKKNHLEVVSCFDSPFVAYSIVCLNCPPSMLQIATFRAFPSVHVRFIYTNHDISLGAFTAMLCAETTPLNTPQTVEIVRTTPQTPQTSQTPNTSDLPAIYLFNLPDLLDHIFSVVLVRLEKVVVVGHLYELNLSSASVAVMDIDLNYTQDLFSPDTFTGISLSLSPETQQPVIKHVQWISTQNPDILNSAFLLQKAGDPGTQADLFISEAPQWYLIASNILDDQPTAT
ncbi:hypothetical protein NEDG_00512 [Nematocida displodere]|uniref:Uncharacterized protein n=1 Tax=Nematocida displodere TaxID=1805483 RepID=A0A177EJB6_9MICR|nr:hypothetical protein NEDG_00512 [Nematocida displodere]